MKPNAERELVNKRNWTMVSVLSCHILVMILMTAWWTGAESLTSPNGASCGRDVGGHVTIHRGLPVMDQQRWPWIVSMQLKNTNRHFCSGTLISPDWIVTAAHCLEDIDNVTREVKLQFGCLNLDIQEPSRVTRNISQVHLHPGYVYNSTDPLYVINDLALIRIKGRVDLTNHVQPACLPDANHVSKRLFDCYVVGWGGTDTSEPGGGPLMETSVKIFRPSKCAKAHPEMASMIRQGNFICAMGFMGGRICRGDSGGPLMCQVGQNTKWTVVGVASWTTGPCSNNEKPFGFADVNHSVNWTKLTANFWSNWQPWQGCSVSCGKGTQNHSRYCLGGTSGVHPCVSPAFENRPCIQQPCPAWSYWQPWTGCSVSCGTGTRIRSRQCLGGAPGVHPCLGPTLQNTQCMQQPCPAWSNWQPWKGCSVTCGTGTQFRSRQCLGGAPGVHPCLGLTLENTQCIQQPCPTATQPTPSILLPPDRTGPVTSLTAVLILACTIAVLVILVLYMYVNTIYRTNKQPRSDGTVDKAERPKDTTALSECDKEITKTIQVPVEKPKRSTI